MNNAGAKSEECAAKVTGATKICCKGNAFSTKDPKAPTPNSALLQFKLIKLPQNSVCGNFYEKNAR
jgi:hypothetical protein